MSLTITQRPSITSSGKTSKWNAVGNPVIYKMQRKDFVFNQINDNGGFVQVQINGVDITGSFANGDSLYVASDNSVYDNFGTQTAEAFSGGNTLITTNIPYVSSAPGGFVNNITLKPSYRVEVEVYDSDDVMLMDEALNYSPTNKGLLTIDISHILKSNLSPDNDADLTGATELFTDTPAYKKFYIKYTEVWTGSAESQTDDVANQFFTDFGARQIPSLYGGNLLEYVVSQKETIINGGFDSVLTPWTNEGAGISFTAIGGKASVSLAFGENSKKLTQAFDFKTGVQYTLTFDVTDGGSASTNLTVRILNGMGDDELYNASGETDSHQIVFTPAEDFTSIDFSLSNGDLGTFDQTLDNILISYAFTGGKFLNTLTRPKMWIGYPFLLSFIVSDDVDTDIEVAIEYFDGNGGSLGTDSTTPATHTGELMMVDIAEMMDVPAGSVTVTVVINKVVSGDSTAISEILTIDIVEPCQEPLFLMGRNHLGGVLQWLFEVSQEEDFNYQNEFKRKAQVLSVAGITKNEWDCLHDFITLGDVYKENIVEFTSSIIKSHSKTGQQLYVVDTEGNKIGVISLNTRNRTQTKLAQHFFEIEIEYPEFLSA